MLRRRSAAILAGDASALVESAKARYDFASGTPAGGSGRDMDSWSTDTVHARERFAFWREVVCRTVLNVATESPPERFSARITGRKFGALRFAAFDSTGHEIVRSRAHVARAPEDYYLISLQLRGRSLITQDDDCFALEPDEIAIVDGQRPFRIAFPEPVSRVIAVVPHAVIDRRAPWLRRPPRRKITPSSPFIDLARRHLLQLTAGRTGLSESEASLLTDNLCNLLALASAREAPPTRLQPELQLAALLAFCRQNLHDPELSPRLAAARLGLSVRTVHLRFETLGQSFGRWVLEHRLDVCGRTLRDPGQRGCSVAEIAYRWGFNDLSHFNKTFRARFGMPPGQWRSLA
jgi:AraC-like DNA-binding protein